MFLVSPPKRVLLHYLVLLELQSTPPPFIESEDIFVFLEKSVYSGNSEVPRVFQVVDVESLVLKELLLSFESILRPHSSRVLDLLLPRDNISVDIGDQSFLLVRETRPKVSDLGLRLSREEQVTFRNQYISHRQHPESPEFFRRVKNTRRKSTRHFRVYAHFYSILYSVLAVY